MATVHVVLTSVKARATTGATVPAPTSIPVASDTVTSTGSSAVSSLTGQLGQFWVITAMDGPVWVKFGAGTPVAAADDGWLIPTGQSPGFSVSVASEKVAIKNAP